MPDQTIYQQPRRWAAPARPSSPAPAATTAAAAAWSTPTWSTAASCKISHRPAQVDARAAAAARLRARRRPDRARLPSRPAAISAAPRSGPRGSGQFERISWDEALDEVARQMLRIRDAYGNAAILDCLALGQHCRCCTAAASAQRFLYMFGGCTELWSNMSAEAEIFAVRMTYGAKADYKSAGPRAHRLRQLEADRDVGLEPGRRHLRHRHAAVPQVGQEARRAHRLRRPARARARAASWPTSTSSSGPRPTPPR